MSSEDNYHKIITSEIAWRYNIAFAGYANGVLIIFANENLDALQQTYLQDELELITGYKISFELVQQQKLLHAMEMLYTQRDNVDERLQLHYYEGNPDHFLGDLIAEAKYLKSSDIHVETYDKDCRVRIRVDGLLVLRYVIEKKRYPALINKIKISANLDIAEKRLPQDGRIFFERGADKFDIRVSIVPALYGEKVVLRLLSNDAANISLDNLGFSKKDLFNYYEGLKRANGIVLISGPTGSGKTTTLYATLKKLNLSTKNIVTIEDPIEYTLQGVNQVQVKENIGLSFAMALRTFLRQDPDIIMLGEIRDAETANMAIRAALTGHLVLSTIHTNSAWGTISRLADMGIPPFLIASTLNISVAQRLVRLLCPDCKKETSFDDTLFPRKYLPPEKVFTHCVPGGCSSCFNTGYKGRKAIYEVIPVDEDLSDEIKRGNSKVNDLLRQKSVDMLSDNAFYLFKSGLTSIDEIYSMLLG